MGCERLNIAPTLTVIKGGLYSNQNDTTDYRFGYNGMEKDKEIKGDGNSYTTEFRQYDPRLGRWASLDPLMAKFPWMSPYVAFDNNPVIYTDPYGLESTGTGEQKKFDKSTKSEGDESGHAGTGKGEEDFSHSGTKDMSSQKSKAVNASDKSIPTWLNKIIQFIAHPFNKQNRSIHTYRIVRRGGKIDSQKNDKQRWDILPDEFDFLVWHFDKRLHDSEDNSRGPYHITLRIKKIPTIHFSMSSVNIPIPRLFGPQVRFNSRGNGTGLWRRQNVRVNGIGIFFYDDLEKSDLHIIWRTSGIVFGNPFSLYFPRFGFKLVFGWGTANISTYATRISIPKSNGRSSASRGAYFTLSPRITWWSVNIPHLEFGTRYILRE